ncbi:MAG: hypothetical protein JST90_09235 [Bacteroidetes bacterium]|nr:hypothetical protein [Bacteroidota bacterium]
MKKIVALFLLASSFSLGQNAAADLQMKVKKTPAASVYICDSKGSVAYHNSKTCRGLQACKHEIKTVTEAEATQLGRRRCKVCY